MAAYTSAQVDDMWNDYVAVYVKDENHAPKHPRRILASKKDCNNGLTLGSDSYVNYSPMPEVRRKLICIKHIVDNTMKV